MNRQQQNEMKRRFKLLPMAEDRTHSVLPSGQIINNGVQHDLRQERKEIRRLLTSHPHALVTFGAYGRRKGRRKAT